MANARKLIDRARPHMDPGERVLSAVLGVVEAKRLGRALPRRGVLMATDRRVAFYRKKVGGYEFEVLPYASISSVEVGKAMARRHVTIYAGGTRRHLARIKDGDPDHFAGVVRERIEGRGAAVPEAARGVEPDFVEILRKLKGLLEAGVLTEAEFEAKKADVLSRI